MEHQLALKAELEVSADLLRQVVAQVVANLDVPLELPGPLPLKLGRLENGTVQTLSLEPDAISLELLFARNLKLQLELGNVHFYAESQTLRLEVTRFAAQGFIGAGLVNRLRGLLLGGAARAANRRAADAVRVEGSSLSVNLAILIRQALSDPALRERLAQALPVSLNPECEVLDFQVRQQCVWVQVNASA